MKNISPIEIVVVVLVLAVIFSTKVMSRFARTSGETVREIKKIKKDFTEALKDDDNKPTKN